MTTEEFIKILEKSNNNLLISNAKDIGKWKGLKHNKESLELLLNHALVEIIFKTSENKDKHVICCSNTTLIKMFSLKNNSEYDKKVKELAKMNSEGIHTREIHNVLTWDFLQNKYCTINLKKWRIGNWIEIKEDNILILNETLKDILDQDIVKNKK